MASSLEGHLSQTYNPGFHTSFSQANRIQEGAFKSPLSEKVVSVYKDLNDFKIKQALENPEGYEAHYELNKKNILSLAEGVAGTALILGPGNAQDIPLLELARQFDQITIVDIDMFAMQKVINNLPANLQNKIHPVQKDLTGFISFISEKIENLDSSVSEMECLDITARIIHETVHKALNSSSVSSSTKYNFVVSSMLTSQLFSEIDAYIMRVFEKKYPGIAQKKGSSPNYMSSLIRLMKHVCIEHLENLSEWTHADGKIYYADITHISAFRYEQVTEEDFLLNVIDTCLALPNEEIDNKIKEIFKSLKDVQQWNWQTSIPKVCEHCVTYGSMTKVAAFCLQPKDQYPLREHWINIRLGNIEPKII